MLSPNNQHGKNIERVHPATLVLPWSAGGEAHSERSVAALMAKFLHQTCATFCTPCRPLFFSFFITLKPRVE